MIQIADGYKGTLMKLWQALSCVRCKFFQQGTAALPLTVRNKQHLVYSNTVQNLWLISTAACNLMHDASGACMNSVLTLTLLHLL